MIFNRDDFDFDLREALSLAEAAKLMRGRKGPPHVATVRRWADEEIGCTPLGPDGPKVVLRTTRVNGNLLTFKEWVEQFERERVAAGQRVVLPYRTPLQRRKALERAERSLDAAGIGGKKPTAS